jgi:hypothetical protein
MKPEKTVEGLKGVWAHHSEPLYERGKTYEASYAPGWRETKGNSYFGFHAFHTRSGARAYKKEVDHSCLAVRKCVFFDVVAEGDCNFGGVNLPSFRANKMIIL